MEAGDGKLSLLRSTTDRTVSLAVAVPVGFGKSNLTQKVARICWKERRVCFEQMDAPDY